MTMTLFGIDNARPITPQETKDAHADIVFVYVGGINNGGRAWTPKDAETLRNAGIPLIPIYVGANYNYNTDNLSYAGGILEAQDAIECAKKFGFTNGYIVADIEYGTFEQLPTMTIPYADAWAKFITMDGQFKPAIYGTDNLARTWNPKESCGYWLASWLNSPNRPSQDNFPIQSIGDKFSALAWQYYSTYLNKYDASILDDRWIMNNVNRKEFGMTTVGTVSKDGLHRNFDETGHTITLGFRSFYEFFGEYALQLFGYPLSEEYTNEDGLTIQWFQRVRFELHTNKNPEMFDVLLGLLTEENDDFHSDKENKKYADSFKKVSYK